MPAEESNGSNGSSGAGIPVVLIDDHLIWRGGVRSLLDDSEFQIVGEAGTLTEGLEVVRATQPRVVLLDIRLGSSDGLEVLHELKAEHPNLSVLMLTSYDNPTFMARAVAQGAAGYLLKDIDREQLLSALRSVAQGEMLLSRQDLVRSLRGVGEHVAGARDLIEPLSNREEEVLRLIATGMPNKEIASMLFVAESTVKTHVENIIGKLGVSDRVQAAVWAVRKGLVQFDEETDRIPGEHP